MSMRARLLLAALSLVAAVLAVYHEALGYGLFGHDTYSVIEASRITSWSDWLGTFREPLMDGQFAIGYFRPTQNLSIALDYALWGLEPFGYQLTNLLVFGAGVLGVFFLTRRLLGERAVLAPFVAGLAFLLYPTLFEVLPVTSRRNHTLCQLFVVWALYAQLSPRLVAGESTGVNARLLPAALALLAMGSNEIGLVTAPLCAAAFWVRLEVGGLAERTRRTLVAASPLLVVFTGFLMARWFVLFGVGGPDTVAAENLFKSTRLLDLVLFPQPGLERSLLWKLALGGFTLTFGLALVVGRAPAPHRQLAVLGVWLAAVCAPILIAGSLRPWYALHPAAPLAVLLGLAAARFLPVPAESGDGAAARTNPLVYAGWLPLALILALLAEHSPLRAPYSQWDVGNARLTAFLADLEERIPSTKEGSVLRSLPVPVRARTKGPRPPDAFIRSPAVLGPLSIPSWVRLVFPTRDIRVVLSNAGAIPAPGKQVLLVLDVDDEP